MRTAFAAAAFAAGALAVPAHRHMHKRDIVVDYDYVTVTDIVTVTAGAPPASTSSAVEVVNNSPSTSSRSHHHWWTWGTSTPVATSTAAPSTTEAPSSAAPTSAEPTSEAPAPSSEAPAPSSYQAPSSSAAPATTAAPSTWATSTKAASTSAAATSASGAAPSTYSDIAVYHHNLHRANHSAPNIEWDDALANTAQTIANSCVYAHNVDQDKDTIGGYGQNIAAGVDAANISAIITDLFYNGEVGWYNGLYGQEQPDMTNFEHWGHFSQIVWKATTKVGCATKVCDQLANVGQGVTPVFTVCNYQSPGNYANEYSDNVGKSLNHPTVQWNAGLPAGYGDN